MTSQGKIQVIFNETDIIKMIQDFLEKKTPYTYGSLEIESLTIKAGKIWLVVNE